MPWTICPGHASNKPEAGVTTAGTKTNDVECTACGEGSVSLIDDALSACYELPDSDGDGLLDRFGYDDKRSEGARNRSLKRTRYSIVKDQDERDGPDGGGEYDQCPFDPNNDEDGDGICARATPNPKDNVVTAGNRQAELYAKFGAEQDHCPFDPNNDADQDGICDVNAPGEPKDKDITTYDFMSNSLVGWRDMTCKGMPDKCPQPTMFRATPLAPDKQFGKDEQRDFKFDRRLREV